MAIAEPYLSKRGSTEVEKQYWESLITSLQRDIQEHGLTALKQLQSISQPESLRGWVPNAELDIEILRSLEGILSARSISTEDVAALGRFISSPSPFVSEHFPNMAALAVVQSIETGARRILCGDSTASDMLLVPLQLANQMASSLLQEADTETPVAATVYELAFVAYIDGQTDRENEIQRISESIWSRLKGATDGLDARDMAAIIASRLGSLVLDVKCAAS